MKNLICITLSLIMLFSFVSCTNGNAETNSQTTSDTMKDSVTTKSQDKEATEKVVVSALEKYAKDAYANMIKNYWSEEKKYFVDPYKDGQGRDTLSDIMWNYAVGMFAFESYYLATGDESAKNYIIKQCKAWLKGYSTKWMLSTGRNNNPAHDDAAWTAMVFMVGYRMTGESKYLDLCHDMIENSYNYWQDGSTANGMWYSYPEDNNGRKQEKSIYCAGLIIAEFEYYEATKGTEREDAELHQRTLDLYEWIERDLGRNGPKEWNGTMSYVEDYLYYCDFEDDKATGKRNPTGYNRPNSIRPASSVSSLLGNTAMAVINKRLYDMTGDETYLDRAVNTANALVHTVYNVSGTIMNDRDAWTNCAFMGSFVREVLPLEGVSPELGRMFMKTAYSIMKYAYLDGGYYGADWTGKDEWSKSGVFGDFRYFSENSNTVHMLFAACYAAKNGMIEIEAKDASLFK